MNSSLNETRQTVRPPDYEYIGIIVSSVALGVSILLFLICLIVLCLKLKRMSDRVSCNESQANSETIELKEYSSLHQNLPRSLSVRRDYPPPAEFRPDIYKKINVPKFSYPNEYLSSNSRSGLSPIPRQAPLSRIRNARALPPIHNSKPTTFNCKRAAPVSQPLCSFYRQNFKSRELRNPYTVPPNNKSAFKNRTVVWNPDAPESPTASNPLVASRCLTNNSSIIGPPRSEAMQEELQSIHERFSRHLQNIRITNPIQSSSQSTVPPSISSIEVSRTAKEDNSPSSNSLDWDYFQCPFIGSEVPTETSEESIALSKTEFWI